MALPRPVLVSEEEFLQLPESMDRVELLDGEVIVSPAPTIAHFIVLKRIVYDLETWARAQDESFFVGQAPVDVRFGPNRILQPDAFVLRGDIPFDHVGPLDRIPELCIEVVSSDRLYDRVTKRSVYASAGVQEYWTLIPSGSGLFERWTGKDLGTREEITGPLTTPLLPGFELDVPALFEP